MGFKSAGFPHYGFNPPGFRLTKNLALPCKDKAVQWISRFTDGLGLDRIGLSGSEVNRDGINGHYFDGDNVKYVEIDSTINLGTSHAIEFLASRADFIGGTKIVMGLNNATVSTILWDSATQIRYRDGLGSNATFVVSLSVDTYYKFQFVRSNTSVSLYIDDSLISTETLATNGDLTINRLFSYNSTSFRFDGNCSYIDLGSSRYDFEDTNTDTKVLDSYGNVNGTIISATGSDRVETTDLEGRMDLDGYTLARALGKNLFNKQTYDTNKFLTGGGVYGEGAGNYAWIFSTELYDVTQITVTKDLSSRLRIASFDQYPFVGITTLNSVIDDSATEKIFTPDSSAKYIMVQFGTSSDDPIGDLLDSIQIEVGATATTYEAWEGYYYDTLQADPVPDGKRSYTLNGKAVNFYDSTGELADAQFVGGLKANLRVVDGVVDNGENYGNWSSVSGPGNVTIESDGILFDFLDTSTSDARVVTDTAIKASTTYTLVYTVSGSSLATLIMAVSATGISSGGVTLSNTDGTYRNTFTTDATITEDFLRIVGISATIGDTLKLSEVHVYEGDYVTGSPTLPATAEPVSGNSLINQTTKYAVVQADLLTTTQMFDHTDADAVVAKVVPVDDFTANDNPRFTRIDSGEITEQALYNETLTNPCLAKVTKHFNI